MTTLYVTDLDGTLLAPDGRISPTSASAMTRLMDAGVLVTCATARSWMTTSTVLGDLRFRLWAVLFNGSFTYDGAAGRYVDQHFVDPAAVRLAVDSCRAHGRPPLVYSIDATSAERVSWVRSAPSAGVRSFWDDRPADPRNAPVPEWADLPHDGVFAVQVIGSIEEVGALATELRAVLGDTAVVNAHPDTYHPEEIWLEIGPAGTSKAVAVRELAERVGADRVVAFGDNLNDLPLFAVADEAYAVGNAVDEVLRAATAVIGSNAEDGVVRWLLEHAEPAG